MNMGRSVMWRLIRTDHVWVPVRMVKHFGATTGIAPSQVCGATSLELGGIGATT